MLIVSVPIIYHIGDGPQEQASMIMGKFLDEPEIERLEDLTKLVLEIPRIDALPGDFAAVLPSITDEKPIFVQPVDDPAGGAERVAGYNESGGHKQRAGAHAKGRCSQGYHGRREQELVVPPDRNDRPRCDTCWSDRISAGPACPVQTVALLTSKAGIASADD